MKISCNQNDVASANAVGTMVQKTSHIFILSNLFPPGNVCFCSLLDSSDW